MVGLYKLMTPPISKRGLENQLITSGAHGESLLGHTYMSSHAGRKGCMGVEGHCVLAIESSWSWHLVCAGSVDQLQVSVP